MKSLSSVEGATTGGNHSLGEREAILDCIMCHRAIRDRISENNGDVVSTSQYPIGNRP